MSSRSSDDEYLHKMRWSLLCTAAVLLPCRARGGPDVDAAAPAAVEEGWFDCTEDEVMKARHLDRAWRAYSRETHPDKPGGSTEAFVEATALKA